MMDWSIEDLKKYDDRIIKIAKNKGLDWFPIDYEICDYYEMIGHMSYHGLPSHYSHWSYGKSFEKTHSLYNKGLQGLPYELIINSNPSIAYLMKENPLYLQVLIMAHCVGHSDFFKNNRTFKDTNPNVAVSNFRSARNRIQKYIENPAIGIEKVERILDAAHCIRFQTFRNNEKRIPYHEKKKKIIEDVNSQKREDFLLAPSSSDIREMTLTDDYDVLGFIIEHSKNLKDWERDLVEIVREESLYFIPQIKTKILNEGWASFWHYNIMKELDLPQSMHLPFLKMHNAVVCPHETRINPYHLGFYLFNKIEKEKGIEECFFIREVMHDTQAILQYLDINDFIELNMFSFDLHKKNNIYYISDVPDEEEGFRQVRDALIRNTGTNGIPSIYVETIEENGVLVLRHDHDGRDLEVQEANGVVDNIETLWGSPVKLFTVLEGDMWEI